MSDLYLRNEVFSWHSKIDRVTCQNIEGWDKPYDYLGLAYEIIDKHSNSFSLIDVVANLKRAIDHRLKRISSRYNFKAMNALGLPKGYLERLETLGIAKPLMIEAIYTIRNLVEHQYSDPPDKKRCSELSDFVWYFLKVTDHLSRQIVTGIVLHYQYRPGYDPIYWLYLDVGLDGVLDWQKLQVRGWIHPDDLSSDGSGSVKVEAHRVRKKTEVAPPEFESDVEWGCLDAGAINFSGEIEINKNNFLLIVKAYFKADELF